MICVYPVDCTDFSTNGILSPMTAQVTETWLLKQGKTVYSISCTGREENESADAELFAGIISGLRVL